MVQQKLILGLGHPRTGTGYTSKLLFQWGLDVKHENMGSDGTIAWQFATCSSDPMPWIPNHILYNDYTFSTIIYNLRNPMLSIPSIAHTEFHSLNYRRKFIPISHSDNIVLMAIESILGWHDLIMSHNIDFVYRIEDQTKDLYNFLASKYSLLPYIKYNNIDYNSRFHNGWSNLKNMILDIPESLLTRLNSFCITYGYPETFNVDQKIINKEKI